MSHHRSKQAGMLTLAEFVRFGFKSLIGIALARLLLPAELGSYRQLFLIYTTFSTLLLLGIPQSLLFFLPKFKHPDSQAEHISQSVKLVSALAFAFAAAILIFKNFIADKFHNPQLSVRPILFAVYPLFMFITQIYSSVMLGLKQPQKAAGFTLFSVVTDCVFILGTALLTRNLHWIVGGVMFSAFLQWGFAQWQLSAFRVPVSFDPQFYRDQLGYSLPLGLSSIIGMLSIQLDKFVISGFFRPEDFAVFSVGAMELPFISILSNSVNSILLPNISSDRAALAEIYRGAVRKNALLVFPLCLLFFLFAQPLITFLYTGQYAASVPFFQVYLLILPLRIASFGIIFMALDRTRYIMYNAVLVLVSNLILNLVLVRTMGMMGAAVATVIVTWLSVVLYLTWMKLLLKLDLAALLPLRAIARTAAATAVAGLATYGILTWLGLGWLGLAVGLVVFTAVYFAAGLAFKAILPYDIGLAKDLVASSRKLIRKEP